jgi:predicted  nucleic acid-binding Zn-ribbon protein
LPSVKNSLVLLLISVSLIACAQHPKPSRFSPPAIAPVRQKISDVTNWVSNAQGHAANAKAAMAAAMSAAKKNQFAQVQVALAVADRELDALTAELLKTQNELHLSNVLIDDYETQIGKIIESANETIETERTAVRAAQADKAKAETKTKAIVSQRNKLFLGLLGSILWIFKGPLIAGLGFVARKFFGLPF